MPMCCSSRSLWSWGEPGGLGREDRVDDCAGVDLDPYTSRMSDRVRGPNSLGLPAEPNNTQWAFPKFPEILVPDFSALRVVATGIGRLIESLPPNWSEDVI